MYLGIFSLDRVDTKSINCLSATVKDTFTYTEEFVWIIDRCDCGAETTDSENLKYMLAQQCRYFEVHFLYCLRIQELFIVVQPKQAALGTCVSFSTIYQGSNCE